MGKKRHRKNGAKSIVTTFGMKDIKDNEANGINRKAEQKEDQFIRSILDRKITINLSQMYQKIKTAFHNISENKLEILGSNLLFPFLYFTGLLIYLEFLLHLILYHSLDGKIIYPILFSILFATIFSFITGCFTKNINRIITWIITGVVCLLFCVQLIYYSIFKVYFSFQSIGMAGDAFSEFGSEIITAMKANAGGLILLILPLLVLALLQKNFMEYERRSFRNQLILCIGLTAVKILTIISLIIFGKGDYSPYDLYYHSKVHDLCGKELGINTMMRIDIVSLLHDNDELVLAVSPNVEGEASSDTVIAQKPFKNKLNHTVSTTSVRTYETPTPSPSRAIVKVDTSPNIINIDFKALEGKEKNRTIRTLHRYFAAATPTNKNKYTGLFKGYNLILITAEGFSPYAVNKEKTPTLYKLTKEGFIFRDFYTALWQTSTSDGEYVALTGLIPVGTRSMYRTRNNYLPFTLGNQFDALGIASKAYHDHTYTYYQRNETHPNLGYDFKGVGNGLVLKNKVWPNSDLEMIDATVPEYIGEDQFHVYYMTVSGHMNYNFGGNSMSYKNRELVKDLPYSSSVKAYIACQMELDKALKQLITKLEKAGVADKTVIALSADHYPYGWEKANLDELAGHTVEPDFDLYRNHFILWCEGMKKNIIVDKPCSSLDILPTLSNLFGLKYDSRLLMGQDIFSDADPLVILSNRSFITDKVKYNSKTGKVINLTNQKLPDHYITNLNKIIKNKFLVSQSILETDYYRKLFK